jgi:hypothetical protein
MHIRTFLAAILLYCLLLFGFGVTALLGQSGILQGTIKDIKTQEELIGARIYIDTLRIGVISDANGSYTLRGIKPGTYVVKASYSGYKTEIKYEVLIPSGITYINFEMSEAVGEVEGVEIVASPFTRTAENPLSIRTIGIDQIRSNPGGNFDVSKVVQSLPGVSGSVGFRNDIIVRGGAPNENVFYLDGVEVPFINHFATQGASGGPAGIINALFIEKVDFQSSAFGAKYDNALSSVLDFQMISGNKERMQRQFQLGASEAGITLDGPIGKQKKTTYLVSARRSYLQFLFSALGLSFLPDYWDFQAKIEHRINDKTTLSFIGLGSLDKVTINVPENPTLEDSAQLEGIPNIRQWSYTNGLVLKRLTKRGFYQLVLSRNMLENGNTKYDFNDESDPSKLRLRFTSQEIENKLRFNQVENRGAWRLAYGGVLQYVKYTNDLFNRDFAFRSSNAIFLDTLQVNTGIGFFKYGAYGSLSRSFLDDRLSASLGIRTDMNSFMDNGNQPLETISPRLSVSYAITEKINISGSVGRYHKIPPYTILGFDTGTPQQANLINKNSKYIRSDHYVMGISYQPGTSTTMSIEGFYKRYFNYPVSLVNGISLANLGGDFGIVGNEAISSSGRGESYGAEAFIQKKLTGRLFGIASYTWYMTSFTGLDRTRKIRSAWDNRHLVSITAGYKFKRNWELSSKLRYLGGFPITPFDVQRSLREYPFTGAGVADFSQLNTLQTGDFLQVDTRIDKKWFFEKWSLNFYIDIQNMLGRANITSGASFAMRRNPDGSIFTDTANPNGVPVFIPNDGGTVIPSFGLIIRF